MGYGKILNNQEAQKWGYSGLIAECSGEIVEWTLVQRKKGGSWDFQDADWGGGGGG